MFSLIFLSSILLGCAQAASDVEIIQDDKVGLMFEYEWDTMDYSFSSESIRNELLSTNSYIPGAAEPFDIDVHENSKIFVTLPRLRKGVPATLGYLKFNISDEIHASVVPYPNLKKHIDVGDCTHIHNVYRIKVDECNRLWVVDSGKHDSLHYCAPKLLAFDLSNDELILSYNIDARLMSPYSLLIAPVVDVRNGKCNDAFVYIADVAGCGIVVYDFRRRTSWFVNSKQFHQNPEFAVDFSVVGTEVDNFELTLGNVDDDGDRKLYFHGLESGHYGYVMTSLIRNPNRFFNKPHAQFNDVHILPFSRARSKTEVMNKDGILFYQSGYRNEIMCWTLEPNNNYVAYKSESVLKIEMEIVTNLKISRDSNNDEVLFIVSIPKDQSIKESSSSKHKQYRILAVPVRNLIKGTKCGPLIPDLME